MISGKQVKEKFMRSASSVAQFNIPLRTVSPIQIKAIMLPECMLKIGKSTRKKIKQVPSKLQSNHMQHKENVSKSQTTVGQRVTCNACWG